MLESLSNMMRSYKREKECHLFFPDLFDLTLPFKKRSEILITGYTYFDITTKKLRLLNFMTIMIILTVFALNGEVKMPFTHKLKKKWIRYNKTSLLVDQMATAYKFNSEKSVMR